MLFKDGSHLDVPHVPACKNDNKLKYQNCETASVDFKEE